MEIPLIIRIHQNNTNFFKLAKASSMALISMLVIIVTVISQGWRVSSDLRGELEGSLFINSGVFQAIGVISFGKISCFEYERESYLCQLSSAVCKSDHRYQSPDETDAGSQTTTVF
jgi:hypothetical protein